jgi:Zn-dependent metalloprotease
MGCSSGEGTPTSSISQSARFECKSKSVQITEHPGPTRGIWEGWETIDSAPGLGRTPELVFVFDQKVDSNGVAGAATLRALECDDDVPSDDAVPLTVETIASGFEHVVRVRPLKELERGCLYQLSFGGDAGLTTNGRCLAAPRELTFRTRAPGEPTALEREATEVRYLPRSFEVSAFKLLPDVHWPATVLFERYAEELGLRIFLDSFAPMAEKRPSVLYPEITYRPYRQMYLGVPVIGAAYSVHEDAEDGVRLVTGTPMLGAALDPPEVGPRVTRQSAIGKAKAAALEQKGYVGRPPGFESEEAELVITTVDPPPAPRDLQLVWRVKLVLSGHAGGVVVLLDAHSGKVLAVRSTASQACSFADRKTMLLIDDDVTGHVQTPQAQLWNDPTAFQMSEYETIAEDPVYVLEGNGLGPGTKPRMFTQCGSESDPNLATVPSAQSDASWGHIQKAAASRHMAVQRCLAYFATRSFRGGPSAPLTPETAWFGLDGVGEVPINIHLGDWRLKDFYDLERNEVYFWVPDDPSKDESLRHAAIDVACHEFGHGVLQYITIDALRTAFEADAIREGFADIVGLLVERSVRGVGNWNWCFGGDPSQNQFCYRNVDSPRSHRDPGTHLEEPQPETYLGHHYCALVDDVPGNVHPDDKYQFCIHHNSTILSHWFYLLTTGGSGVNDRGCTYSLMPLLGAAPQQASLNAGELVLFHALREHAPPDSGFVALASATLSAAKAIFGDAAVEVGRVARAWAAVGVWENFWEGENARIAPARGATDVNPWAPIRWIPEPHETSWDIQIFIGPDLRSATLYAEATVADLVTVGGKDYAAYHIALLPQARYYWRVRPHMDRSWEDCYPVHFFDTGDLPTVTDLAVTAELTPEGLVRPGTIDVEWTRASGSLGYTLQADTTNPRCASTSSTAITEEVTDDPYLAGLAGASLSRIQPSEEYWLTVNPIGPHDPTGMPATGPCSEIQFTTTQMRPPIAIRPDGGVFHYRSPHGSFGAGGPLAWSWTGLDGPERYELRFFDRAPPAPEPSDPLDACGATPLLSVFIDEPCQTESAGETCEVTVDDDLFPVPNPTGYCWEVISIATNEKTSEPSDRLFFRYGLPSPQKIAPGVTEADAAFRIDQGALVDHIVRDPVDLSWFGDPDAAGYLFKMGRWPWLLKGEAPDPPNCFPFSGTCINEPLVVTHRDFVGDTSVRVDGARAGMGRYVWTVWPLLGDPHSPGSVSERQPLVDGFPIFSYTTGPALPEIKFDAATTVFRPECDAFTGTVTFPFAPSSVEITGQFPAQGFLSPGLECEKPTVNRLTDWTPEVNWIYPDKYDCTYAFEIPAPAPQGTYTITARAFGVSTQEDQVVTESFSTSTCGHLDGPCCECDGSSFCLGRAACVVGTCRPCGGKGENCCDPDVTGFACEQDLECQGNNRCGCGRTFRLCCAGGTCRNELDACVSGVCEPSCGFLWYPCCPDGDCLFGECVEGECVESGMGDDTGSTCAMPTGLDGYPWGAGSNEPPLLRQAHIESIVFSGYMVAHCDGPLPSVPPGASLEDEWRLVEFEFSGSEWVTWRFHQTLLICAAKEVYVRRARSWCGDVPSAWTDWHWHVQFPGPDWLWE